MLKYTKAVMAFFTALGTWGATAFADNGLTAVEAFGLCGVIVAALAVYQFPNEGAIHAERDERGRFVPKD